MTSSNKMYYLRVSFWVDTLSGSSRNVSIQTLYFANFWMRLILKIMKMMAMTTRTVLVLI